MTTEYELKAQARRLSKGLSALDKPVTHSQALDLIGLVHGKRDWKELIGLLKLGSAANAEAASVPDSSDESFLLQLEFGLRCRGLDEFDVDEMVHDVAAPDVASSINNQGLYDQLEFLLKEYQTREALLEQLHKNVRSFEFAAPVVRATAWGPNIPAVEFDALPWLAQADDDELRALIATSRTGQVGNCDAGDQVALWCRDHGRDYRRADRQELKKLFERIHHQALAHSDMLGVTVNIDAEQLEAFLEEHRAHQPEVLSELLNSLDDVR